MKILIIEDDADIAELLAYNLRQEKWTVVHCASGAKGLASVRTMKPDLIILDLMLPDMGGLDICKAVKSSASTRTIPILMVTAKGEEIDRVVGFEVGADDYMTKPFSPRELVLRVKAILRRRSEEKREKETECIACGVLVLDPLKFEVSVRSQSVRLTAIEFKLLHYLLLKRGRVVTRDTLLNHVWGYDSALVTRTVDVHIKRLRAKIGPAAAYIETIRGIGYRLIEAPEAV